METLKTVTSKKQQKRHHTSVVLVGERQVWNLAPFTDKDFKIRGLGDRVKDLPNLQFLYPDIPKNQAFQKFWSASAGGNTITFKFYVHFSCQTENVLIQSNKLNDRPRRHKINDLHCFCVVSFGMSDFDTGDTGLIRLNELNLL